MDKWLNLIRPDLREFKSYSSARDEAKHGKIWLNANELPWDIANQNNLQTNRYPQRQPLSLLATLAPVYAVTPEQIVMLRGSDEAIDLLIRLFCRAEKDAIMICPPTFGMYSVYARLQGAHVIEVPLEKENDFQLNVAAMMQQWQPTVKLLFLCSPNNPTGQLIKADAVFSLCEKLSGKSIVVVDEAYIEFSDNDSFAKAIQQHDNLAVLRTFSKAYGLAGARCGTLLADPNLIAWILKIMAPYPLSSLTVQAITEALQPQQMQIMQEKIACIKSERNRLYSQLKQLRCVVKVWQSDANFLLLECTDRVNLFNECVKHGIIIRDMHDKLGLQNCVRISIGTPAENTQVLELLKDLN